MLTARGGMATEASGGAALEVRPFGDLILGGSIDGGVNMKGTLASYSWYAPAAYGGYSFFSNDIFDVRGLAGARFPMGVSTADEEPVSIVKSSFAAFTASLRFSFMFGMWVVGLQGDMTPHSVMWDYKCPNPLCVDGKTGGLAGKPIETTEWMWRGALVVGIALGKSTPGPDSGSGGGGDPGGGSVGPPPEK